MPIFAINILEGPWLVILIALFGAIANWLTKRRQEKQAEREGRSIEEPPPAPAPGGKKELEWEKALRQLLGEDETPPPQPAPPLIPPVRRPPPPPRLVREEHPTPVVTNVPQRRMPPAAPARPMVVTSVREPAPVAPRVATPPATMQPAMSVAEFARAHQTRSRRHVTSPWRNRRHARDAFVASLVFGTPKGLES